VSQVVDGLVPELPTTLPPVERRAAIPRGFVAAAIAAGIKASGRPDLGLLALEEGPASVAAVFTNNLLPAAPVRLSQAHLATTAPEGKGRYGWTDGVICTSGLSNAATGRAGDADQSYIADLVADELGVRRERTLHLSTGLIGVRLPLDKVEAGLAKAGAGLEATDDAWEAVAIAMRTTDSSTKVSTTTVELPGAGGRPVEVTVSGMAKGVGMIHPLMATMLAVIATDAAISPAALDAILRPATTRTWNQLTIDGDTSTNDTVFLLASGAARNAPIEEGSAGFAALAAAIEAVARDLARQQAADGEGATTVITCQVSGATDDAEARAVARSVVGSSLFKAAVHGRDPNWGRIADAIGNARLPEAALLEAAGFGADEAHARRGAQVAIDPERLRIAIAGSLVFDGTSGGPQTFDQPATSLAMNAPEVLIRLDLGLGDGTGEAFGCDLTEQYVIENSEYTT
jgi:glutamate N-acetyltransferase/amino-acid N-acetyltransferase